MPISGVSTLAPAPGVGLGNKWFLHKWMNPQTLELRGTIRIFRSMFYGEINSNNLLLRANSVVGSTRLWTVVLEKTPESPLDSKEIKSVNLKGNQPWIHIGKTDAEAETPVFWSSDANNWLIEKVPDAGKDWGQKEKRASEDEMAGWYHQCNGHELGQTSGGLDKEPDLNISASPTPAQTPLF